MEAWNEVDRYFTQRLSLEDVALVVGDPAARR
jgi:hypothetical protein